MYGSQEYHLHVRVITAVELLMHRAHYDAEADDYCEQLSSDQLMISSYSHLVSTCTNVGDYAELVHFYAMSAALGIFNSLIFKSINLISHHYRVHFWVPVLKRITLLYRMMHSNSSIGSTDAIVHHVSPLEMLVF